MPSLFRPFSRAPIAVLVAGGLAAATLTVLPAHAEDDARMPDRASTFAPKPAPEPSPAVGIIVQRSATAQAASVATSVTAAIREHIGATALPGRVDRVAVTGQMTAYRTGHLDAAQAQALADEIAQEPGVEWATPDSIAQATSNPWPTPVNDPGAVSLRNLWDTRPAYGDQLLAQVNPVPWPAGGVGTKAPALWPATTGAGVTVAVIDSGVRTDHPDLAANLLPGYDFISDVTRANDGTGRDADANDPGDWSTGTGCAARNSSWHGTHVAGTVAAVANNGIGVAGVAPGAKILPVRVLGRCGGTRSDIAAGMVWAAGGTVPGVPANPNPAKILNMSLGGSSTTCDPAYASAISTVRGLGATVIVSAGNDTSSISTATPANCAGVVTVAAVSDYGDRAAYSNVGPEADISAPGGYFEYENMGIWSTVNTGTTTPVSPGYGQMQGTSMAAPAVAGAAALVSSLGSFTPDQMEAALKAAVMPFPTSPFFGSWACTTSVCGMGIIDLTKVPAPTAPPAISGSGVAGSPLSATTGAWVGPAVPLSTTWLVNGVAVAEGPVYTPTAGDAGKSITAYAHVVGGPYATIGRSSAAVMVTPPPVVSTKMDSRIKLKFPKRIKRGGKATGKIKVTTTGPVTGTVTVFLKVGRKKQRATLRMNNKGVAKFWVRISRSTTRFKLKATYSGSATAYGASTGWRKYRTRR